MSILKLLLIFSQFLFSVWKCDVLLAKVHNRIKFCESNQATPCDFDKEGNTCVLSIFKHGKSSTIHSECGKCPFQTGRDGKSIICTRKKLKNPSFRRTQYACCCSMPHCLDIIESDFKVGWETKTDNVDCERASYNNSKFPRWTDRDVIEQDHIFWRSSRKYPICHMKITTSEMTDPRSGAVLPNVELTLGYGCPKDPEYDDLDVNRESYVITFDQNVIYCCYGTRCNTEIYRDLGFEVLQNMIFAKEQEEYYRRISYEMKNYKMYGNGTFFSANKKRWNLYPKYLIPIGALAVIYLVWKVRVVDIEKLPAKKSFVIVEREEEDEDFNYN